VEPSTVITTGILAFLTPALSWFIWTWWRKKGGRKLVKDKMDKVEDALQEGLGGILGQDIAKQLRETLDSFETRIGDKIDKRLGAAQPGSTFEDSIKDMKSDLLGKVDELLKTVPVKEEVLPPVVLSPPLIVESSPAPSSDDMVKVLQGEFARLKREITDNFEQRLAEKVPNSITNIIRNHTQPTVEPEPEPEAIELPITPQGLEYAKQLFTLKGKEGETVRQWAVFAQLYREAVSKLRTGTFFLEGTTKLQGQARTADAIDNWVRKEFLKSLTIQDARDKDSLYKDALLGVLYKDAVDNLRCGHIDILGAETTAAAIQAWVEKEFLRRMGIKLT